jgi:hypothetical protein
MGGVASSNVPTLTDFTIFHDTGGTGGGGGGGAVTIANGADVAEGSVGDAAWVSGNGTVISLLKNIANSSSSGGAVTIADGADVAEGATADVAYVSGSGTTISLLKGIFAKLATIITNLGSPFQAGGSIGNTTFASTQGTSPWVVSGTVTANAGTNLNTSALALDATVTARLNTLGQKVMASSAPVVIASDQSAVPISGTVTTTPPANASTNIAQVGGNTVTTLASGEQKVGVEGLAASGAAKSGNPVQSGAVFNSTQPTVTTGQAVENQATARGSLIVATGVDTFTVDTELPAAAALGDAAAANPTTPTIGNIPLVMNATTVDRQRAVVNAQDSTGTGIAAAGILGQFDDVSPSSVTENQFAPIRMSSKREVYVVVRDAAGNNRGANVNSNNQVSVSVDNTGAVVISSAVTSVNDSNINQTLLNSNSARKGYKLFNDSTVTGYVKEGTTATTSDYSYQLFPKGYYESVGPGCYTGRIDCIWAADASGAMKVTELS